jgi:plastocyanin
MNIAEENTGNGQQLSVKVGDSVIWVADDNMMHNVDFTAGSPSIPATSLFGGSSSTKQSPPITFTTAGTWSYVCDIHTVSSMKGTIQVQ